MGTGRHRVGIAFAIVMAIWGKADRAAAHWIIDSTGNVTLDINFRYPPIASDLARVEAQLNRARLALCDATDGQVKLNTVNFTSGEGSQETADIWLLDHLGRSSATGVITLFSGDQFGDVIAHELGHHLFNIGDEYPENRRDAGCGIGPSFDQDVQLDEVWHSIMQNSGWQICRDPNTGLSLSQINPQDFWDVRCSTDADCGELCTAPGCPTDPMTSSGFVSFVCPNPPLLASELSVALNHDQRKGDGAGCPAPRAGSIFTLGAQLHPDEWASTPTPSAGDRSRDCGNGVIDAGESCDGTNLNGETCTSLGYSSGLLGCHANCGFSTGLCGAPSTSCGDSILQAGEECDGSAPWPSGISCADFGFTGVDASVPYANLSCNSNCTANVSQCPGTVTAFDPSTFETAQETAILWTQVEVIDSLGRLEGPGALFGGQSSHQLWVFFEHVSGDAWTLWFYGRGEEYQGGVAGTPYLIGSLALVFSGPDLLTVNGNSATDPISITLGGMTTGPFTPGADSSVAPEIRRPWRVVPPWPSAPARGISPSMRKMSFALTTERWCSRKMHPAPSSTRDTSKRTLVLTQKSAVPGVRRMSSPQNERSSMAT